MLRTKYIVVGRRASCGRAVGEEEGWWKNYRTLRESQRIMSVICFGSSLDQALLCSNRVTAPIGSNHSWTLWSNDPEGRVQFYKRDPFLLR